tara:strand:+ start:19 stop:225 length:207 start_codon:yes stop_codon:yes gene_type:complete
MSKITINLNGKTIQANTAELLDLLSTEAPNDRPFAVEINGIIVPSSDYKDFKVKDNDQIEIIAAVGGG